MIGGLVHSLAVSTDRVCTYTRERRHTHVHTCICGYVWPLFSARPFIRRKTLWCISFDAVCALVMQIPRLPASWSALAAVDFQRYRRAHCLFGRPRGMEIPHRQGRVNFDMYARNGQPNYTAAMHNACQPNGNRLHQTRKREREEGKRQGGNRRCLLASFPPFSLSLSF